MDNNVPYAALEVMSARHESIIKRLCITFVIVMCLLMLCNTILVCYLGNRVIENSDNNTSRIIEQMTQSDDEQN